MPTNGPALPSASTQRQTPPWTLDITALETGSLGDPTTALVTELARSTALPATNGAADSIALLPTDRLPSVPASLPLPSSPKVIGTPPRHTSPPPAAAEQAALSAAVQPVIRWHRQQAAQLRHRADALQAVLQREAHQTQTLFTRYDMLRRQLALSAHERRDLQTLATLLPQRSAQLAQWRMSVQQDLLAARAHEEAAASLLRTR